MGHGHISLKLLSLSLGKISETTGLCPVLIPSAARVNSSQKTAIPVKKQIKEMPMVLSQLHQILVDAQLAIKGARVLCLGVDAAAIAPKNQRR